MLYSAAIRSRDKHNDFEVVTRLVLHPSYDPLCICLESLDY